MAPGIGIDQWNHLNNLAEISWIMMTEEESRGKAKRMVYFTQED